MVTGEAAGSVVAAEEDSEDNESPGRHTYGLRRYRVTYLELYSLTPVHKLSLKLVAILVI